MHLEAGGRAFRSPGTTAAEAGRAGAGRCLWWKKADDENDKLHLVDCEGTAFTWPGTTGSLRREKGQAGKLAGFVGEARSDGTGKAGVRRNLEMTGQAVGQVVRFSRDPAGFLFPGCLYVLEVALGLPCIASGGGGSGSEGSHHEYLVALHGDGTITDRLSGDIIASWSFLGGADGTTYCAEGNALVLRIKSEYQVHMCWK